MRFFVHRGPSGSIFVKDGDFFVSQGGLTQTWGRFWKMLDADSIEHARFLAGRKSLEWWTV